MIFGCNLYFAKMPPRPSRTQLDLGEKTIRRQEMKDQGFFFEWDKLVRIIRALLHEERDMLIFHPVTTTIQHEGKSHSTKTSISSHFITPSQYPVLLPSHPVWAPPSHHLSTSPRQRFQVVLMSKNISTSFFFWHGLISSFWFRRIIP